MPNIPHSLAYNMVEKLMARKFVTELQNKSLWKEDRLTKPFAFGGHCKEGQKEAKEEAYLSNWKDNGNERGPKECGEGKLWQVYLAAQTSRRMGLITFADGSGSIQGRDSYTWNMPQTTLMTWCKLREAKLYSARYYWNLFKMVRELRKSLGNGWIQIHICPVLMGTLPSK